MTAQRVPSHAFDVLPAVKPDGGLTKGMKLCVCGHSKGAHLMNMRTYQCTGPCRRGHYGAYGRYIGGGCDCAHYHSAKTRKNKASPLALPEVDR
jgi:hypothetical protein